MSNESDYEREWKKEIGAKNQRLLRWFLALLMLYPLGRLYTSSQRENVREAAVRELGKQSGNLILFLKVDGADADNAFLQRFQNDAFTVRSASQAVKKRHSLGWNDMPPLLFEPDTGRRGREINLSDVHWNHPFQAETTINEFGRGDTYTVTRTWNGWSVTQKRMAWIA